MNTYIILYWFNWDDHKFNIKIGLLIITPLFGLLWTSRWEGVGWGKNHGSHVFQSASSRPKISTKFYFFNASLKIKTFLINWITNWKSFLKFFKGLSIILDISFLNSNKFQQNPCLMPMWRCVPFHCKNHIVRHIKNQYWIRWLPYDLHQF